ncbi:MAG: hypothetical protein M3Q36_00675 [bacterium]|nr:hypothetical protein [bacterium]
MNILRKLAIGFLAMALFSSSLAMAWTNVASRTFRDREVVKGWLEESDFYGTITPAILENINVPTGDNGDHLPIEDKELQDKLSGVLDDKFVRDSTGTVMDGVYNWLEGDTDQPDFAIKLGDTRRKLAAAIGDYAGDRAKDLPRCKSVPKDTNPLSLTCLPAGASPATIAASAEAQLLSNKDFLSDSTFTAEDLAGEGQDPAIAFHDNGGDKTRTLYKLGSYGTIIFGVLSLLAALGIILLSHSRTQGMRRAGITLISSSVILGISYLFMKLAPSRFSSLLSSAEDGTPTQNLFARMFDVIAADIRGIVGWYAVIFALLGLGLIVGAYLLKKRGARTLNKPDIMNPIPPQHDSPRDIEKQKVSSLDAGNTNDPDRKV